MAVAVAEGGLGKQADESESASSPASDLGTFVPRHHFVSLNLAFLIVGRRILLTGDAVRYAPLGTGHRRAPWVVDVSLVEMHLEHGGFGTASQSHCTSQPETCARQRSGGAGGRRPHVAAATKAAC